MSSMCTKPGLLACRQEWADQEFSDLYRAQDAVTAVLGISFISRCWEVWWCSSEAQGSGGPVGKTLTDKIYFSCFLSSGQMVQESNIATRKVSLRKSSTECLSCCFSQFSEMLWYFGSFFLSASFPSSLTSTFLKLHSKQYVCTFLFL